MGAGETANWTLCLQFTLTSLVSFERLANLKFISCFIFQQINTFHGVTSTYRRTKTWKTKTLPKIQIKRKEINTHTLTHKLSPTLCELNEMEENLINGLQDIKACTRRAFSSLWNRREEISFPCFQHIHFASWMCGAKNIFCTIFCLRRKAFKEICSVFEPANWSNLYCATRYTQNSSWEIVCRWHDFSLFPLLIQRAHSCWWIRASAS